MRLYCWQSDQNYLALPSLSTEASYGWDKVIGNSLIIRGEELKKIQWNVHSSHTHAVVKLFMDSVNACKLPTVGRCWPAVARKAGQNLRFPVNPAENRPDAGGLMPGAIRPTNNDQREKTSKSYYITAPLGAFYFLDNRWAVTDHIRWARLIA